MAETKFDIALLLEGTYPYVRGGVSSWVHQIIQSFPEYRFGLVFLGSRPEDYGEMRYELPPNVAHLETHYLHQTGSSQKIHARRGNSVAFEAVNELHEGFKGSFGAKTPDLSHVAEMIMPGGPLSLQDFLYSKRSWEMICERYERFCTDPSFVDYFWTVRLMHAPLWQLAKIAANLPLASVYHTISTGYAGFLAALLHHRHGKPMIVSEHGIYTKERKIDLLSSEWIRDNRNVFQRDPTQMAYLRQLWVHFFEWLGKFCYQAANPIIALFEANRLRQIHDGAPAERTMSIPNGVAIHKLAPLRDLRPTKPPQVMCLIGRVVPIKDIKTFIRAARIVCTHLPNAEAWIAGPEDEDPSYASECHDLVKGLNLEGKVKFLGFQKIPELLPRIGVNVLSSISEGLPLVIIEGFAAGVPCVATDVGSCRQLIEGLDPEDKALGSAGVVVPIADAQALADAIIPLLADEQAWLAASKAGVARVERYYTEEQMIDAYRSVYRKAMGVLD